MKRQLKILLYDFAYCITNYFVAYIPCWHIRKLFYLLLGMKIGAHSRISMRVVVFSPWKIRIGESTIVNERVVLDGRGGLIVGNNVSISYGALVYSASHSINSNTFEGIKEKVEIADGVWLCANCIVLPGSSVMKNTVIAANAVFKGTTEPNGVYGGIPAKKIKERDVNEVHLTIRNYFR